MRNIKKSPVVILFIVAAVLYVIIYILPQVTGVLRSSYTAEYGELKTFDKVEGYFVRSEFVYFSNVTGAANRYIDENKLVRRGTRIMEVTPGGTLEEDGSEAGKADNKAGAEDTAEETKDSKKKDDKDSKDKEKNSGEDAAEAVTEDGGKEAGSESKTLDTSQKGLAVYSEIRDNVKGEHHIDTDDFVTEQEGILTYHADGNESRITPENMEKKNKAFFQKLKNSSDLELNKYVISETDPVFKIVDRAAWYIVCYVPREHESRYAVGSRVSVLINDEKTITGTVQSITDERREKRLTIKTNNWYDHFATLRKADIEVITSDVMGLIISNTSIVEKKGQKGVYVRQKTGKYKFVPINIIATDGTNSAISASQYRNADGDTVTTVRSYDDILRRPDRQAS
ncbi:MAG: HlyD family efflux transporter periplasmic adaptor subunit [Eubacterium sp.]|nr:HlyD family efflux transporter periplasmic adaptor subunit [Eubacterium sp.]